MEPIVREQILAVRDTGEANMLDTKAVSQVALREGYYELVVYLEEHKSAYGRFILTGKEDE